VTPSGKLATTFLVNYSDNPSSYTFPGKVTVQPEQGQTQLGGFRRGQPAEVTYDDGIYVGYRYFNSFTVPVSYEFGYGLSYTPFEVSGLKLSSTKFSKNLTATVTVKNTGVVAGKEVVQLYLSAPASRIDKPESELKGFIKTKLLQPGESQLITFVLDPMSLASFDTGLSSWIAEAGKYVVKIGTSSKNIILTANFDLSKPLTLKKESIALKPKAKINEINPEGSSLT